MTDALAIIGYLGVVAFAASGALAAGRQGMDVFGFAVLALLPAVGGGTVRDLLLDQPPFWIDDQLNIWLALGTAAAVYAVGNHINRGRLLSWFDAGGLAVFSVFGAQKALMLTGSALVAVMLGVTTAVVGGILRDVVCNDVPLVLRREIYATAAFVGAGAYCALTLVLPAEASVVIAVALAFAVRAVAMAGNLSLPSRKIDP